MLLLLLLPPTDYVPASGCASFVSFVSLLIAAIYNIIDKRWLQPATLFASNAAVYL